MLSSSKYNFFIIYSVNKNKKNYHCSGTHHIFNLVLTRIVLIYFINEFWLIPDNKDLSLS